ncbi:hypothetical protein AJ80_05484 [Polytolypa hystricis UAMH7299]|uniref:Sulfite oxidase n=1 Tax=Polytolypa hystricis (strain UAMH7299) TaxID=1447883 RepID=A0A2B7Y3A2_POLH7|nr:hypothetical protein AJ80_05484 [Polytolypa hystricis UAMH7299]
MITKLKDPGEPPLNREAPLRDLISSFITTKEPYNRNHSAIPIIEASSHVVTVDGEVETPLSLSVSQLRNDFVQHEVIAALQCAGNRRHTMRTRLKEVAGIDWLDGAVMNCKWKGPRLRDVLIKAGLKERNHEGSKLHVAVASHQLECQDDDYYGGSIELWRAMRVEGEVILALEMNGKPLAPSYGYPVRVVAPGIAGARWVKWLDKISVQNTESPNFYQQHDYKILPPEALTWEIAEDYWHRVPAIQCMPVNSVVAVPGNNETVRLPQNGLLEVKGYAVPKGDQGPVTKVEVSADGGKTWVNAEINYPENYSKWSWALWKASIKVDKGSNKTIYSRATDAGGNVQPEHCEWNLRGIGYNAYGSSFNVTIS